MIVLMIALCVIILALAGLCVWLWRKCRQENGRKWDLRSENLTLEKKAEQDFELLWRENLRLYTRERVALENYGSICAKYVALQERLSSKLCPHESHIWDDVGDGVKRCRRCGLEKGEMTCL